MQEITGNYYIYIIVTLYFIVIVKEWNAQLIKSMVCRVLVYIFCDWCFVSWLHNSAICFAGTFIHLLLQIRSKCLGTFALNKCLLHFIWYVLTYVTVRNFNKNVNLSIRFAVLQPAWSYTCLPGSQETWKPFQAKIILPSI